MLFCQLKCGYAMSIKQASNAPPNSAASLPANLQRDVFDRAQAIELPMKMTILRVENNFLPAVREI
jgi:hypothetical protein